MKNRKGLKGQRPRDRKRYLFSRHFTICASPKDARQLPSLRGRVALLTNPGRQPIRFPHQEDKEQQMGSCNCQEVIWKCKAMRLVVFTITRLTFPSLHFSFNELFNFTCWVPYQYYSFLLVLFIYFILNFSLKKKFLLIFPISCFRKIRVQFSTKRSVAVPQTVQISSIKILYY